MKIRLFIDGKQADLADDTLVLFNYQFADHTDPAAVKNSYTKTVRLEGTPTNNAIFSHIYRNDFRTATGFAPMQRTPFRILNDLNEVLEAGYLRLDSVETAGGVHRYNVTLFGGLGGVLYSLMYSATGEKLSLADLDFGRSLTFNIDRNAVRDAWYRIVGGMAHITDDPKWDIINFAPCYNGIPDTNFSADKMLVPTPAVPNMTIPYTQDGKDYDGQGGYAKIDLGKAYDEWAIKDLRSYLQRPVVSLKQIVYAIQSRLEADGYTVTLDDDWFDDGNDYFANTWLTLPMLNQLEVRHEAEDIAVDTGRNAPFTEHYSLRTDIPSRIKTTTPKTFRVKFKPRVYAATSATLANTYLGRAGYADEIDQVIIAELVAYDKSGAVVGYSDFYYFGDTTLTWQQICTQSGYTPHTQRTPWQYPYHYLQGHFSHNGGNEGTWTGNAADITIADTGATPNVASFVLYLDCVRAKATGAMVSAAPMVLVSSTAGLPYYPASHIAVTDEGSNLHLDTMTYSVRSGVEVTQSLLMGGTQSPADYLLALLKTFGLVMVVDDARMSVEVMTRPNYFDGKVVDLTDRIDRYKPMTASPLVMDARWLKFGLPMDGGAFANYYAGIYGRQYGTQRVNTGYPFNADETDVLESVCLRSFVTALERSKYFYNAYNGTKYAPAPFLDGGNTITLWHGGEPLTMDAPTVDASYDVAPMNAALPSYDRESKPQFHDEAFKPLDGVDCLLLLDGYTVDAAYNRYCLTDDTPLMSALNDDTPCWLGEQASRDPAYSIGLSHVFLPRFRGYMQHSNGSVWESLDFGVPSELADPSVTSYLPSVTLYPQTWKRYITDLMDEDTRRVVCSVNFRGLHISRDALRHFYAFDGAIWVLNAIRDYSLTTAGSTECEFIKVQDKSNYTNY